MLTVRTQPADKSAVEAWAGAFGLNVPQSKSDPHEVNQKLFILRQELDLLEKKMEESKYSQNLFKPYIQKLRSIISHNNLATKWSSFTPVFSEDTILALRYCAEILDPEELIDIAELEKILSELDRLKEELVNSSISGATYAFVMSQIDIIENAIRSYPVTGVTAIKKAFSDGFSDLNSRAEDLKKEKETKATRDLGGIWKDLKTVGGEVVEADRLATAYINIINKGPAMAESLISLLPSV